MQLARGSLPPLHTAIKAVQHRHQLQVGHFPRSPLRTACRSMASQGSPELLQSVLKCVPPLSGSNYKGQHGKVAVVGGCEEYTGAPYFAAMSALKVGADLAYVFCTKEAAPVIKGYSPELIVLPVLPHSDPGDRIRDDSMTAYKSSMAIDRIMEWLPRVSVLVVGPGLGGDPWVAATAERLIKEAKELGIPCLVDGSAITHVAAKNIYAVQGFKNCILTPNIAELGRLANSVGIEPQEPIGTHWQKHSRNIAQVLDGPVIISKGSVDLITDGRLKLECSQESSPRRAGGQGDVLAGAIATFMCWVRAYRKQNPHTTLAFDKDGIPLPDLMAAAYAGSALTRAASAAAFAQHGRGMLAGDVIQHLAKTLEVLQK